MSFARQPLNSASQERLITFLLKAAAFYQVPSCVSRACGSQQRRGGPAVAAVAAENRRALHVLGFIIQHKPFLSLSLSPSRFYYLVARSNKLGAPASSSSSSALYKSNKKLYIYVIVYVYTLCDKLRLVILYHFIAKLPRLRPAKPDPFFFH